MKKISVILLLIISVPVLAQVERPREVWVTRSVLDNRARIVTISLHNDLWIAYSTENCGFFKAWKEGVLWDGAVYTKKHGPQPTSLGSAYSEDEPDNQVWKLYKNGAEVENTKAHFKGYKFINKHTGVTLMYEITTADGKEKVAVEETPEYVFNSKTGLLGLERKFEVKGLPSGTSLVLLTHARSMPKLKTDFLTNAKFEPIEITEYKHAGMTTYGQYGKLFLNASGITSLTVYYYAKPLK